MKPKRLGILYDGRGFGGAEVHLELLLRYLDRSRFQAELIIPGRLRDALVPQISAAAQAAQVPVSFTDESSPLGPLSPLLHLVQLARELRRLKLDVLHVQTSNVLGLRKELAAARLSGVPAIRMLHTSPGLAIARAHRRWSAREVRLVDRWVARDLTVSATDRLELIATFELPPNKIEVCYHGLELDRFRAQSTPGEARRALGLPDALTVGVIGRLDEVKGHRFLVEAAPRIIERCGEVRFLFVGMGAEESPLRSRVRALGLTERFTFAGFHRDVRPWVEAVDLVVMPSLFEAAGLVLLESLALRRPVVASDLPCVRDQVGDRGCVRVPPGDSAAIADATAALLSDPQRRRSMADEGETVVRERFDIKRHVNQLMAAYDEVARV